MKLKLHKPEIHEKAWGREIWIANNEEYCGKILEFFTDAKFSMHFHNLKAESWYVLEGRFTLKYIDTNDASEHEIELNVGDAIDIHRFVPHQLIAHEAGSIMEVSTEHYESDSYRVRRGDSQTKDKNEVPF